tara:strand:- start:259 stop:414 length:156 start_codon:yes stop_codon:yes gene_type:complete
MFTYKLIVQEDFKVLVRSDGLSIPFAPDNTDYQEYLAWVSEGNTPQPADGE